LTVVSERSVREVALEEDTDELSTVNVQSFVDEQEWRLYSNVETRVEVVTRVYQGDDCSHPSFSTLCHASRRFGFYFWNILFVMVETKLPPFYHSEWLNHNLTTTENVSFYM